MFAPSHPPTQLRLLSALLSLINYSSSGFCSIDELRLLLLLLLTITDYSFSQPFSTFPRRTIESRATLEHRSQRDVGQMLMGIFSSLCQRLSGPTHDFVPTKSIISQCVYMLGKLPYFLTTYSICMVLSRHPCNQTFSPFALLKIPML